MPIRTSRALVALLLPLLVAACQTLPAPQPQTPEPAGAARAQPSRTSAAASPALADTASRLDEPAGARSDPYRVFKGTGVVVKGQLPGGGVPSSPVVQQAGGAVVLNFEAADVREVIRNVLGEILGQSYTIDPAVGGQVTIRTTSGIPRDALYPTLETLLRTVGATMVKEGSLFRIVPQAASVRGNVTPQLGSSQRALPQGYSVQIVPLRYVGARDMLRLLEPFAKDAQAVRADELRNLMILSGTERELRHLLDTIDMFDIDWMAGMSAGVFTLQNADVKSVMQELEKVVGPAQQSPLAGILRIVPIERMNAILVISPNPGYLEQAKLWVERLDRGGGSDGPRLYVYALQNSRAEKVAPLLQQAFTGRGAPAGAAPPPTLAPGTPAGSIVSPPAFGNLTPTQQQQQQATAQAAASAAAAATAVRATAPATGPASGTGIVRNLQAVADKDNNTIIIVATPVEYQVIESALKKLDVPARQVVIEMTIAEVLLTDELKFGVDWLFRSAWPDGRGSGGLIVPRNSSSTGTGSTGATGSALSDAISGFTYLVSNAKFPGGIQAVLRVLDTYGTAKIISNPHVAALDNQKATIKVGNRIPISQETIVGGTTTGTVTTTSQYIDTGVLVQVTPHINAGGLVTLEVQAEVSQPGTADPPGSAPPINTRSIQTYVAVPSGETMIMGGLILETDSRDSRGLPLLSRIPGLGGLFGEQALNKNRTELVLFVTPRVVESEFDVRSVVDDLRKRMERLDATFPATRPGGPPAVPPSPPEFVAPR
jgi:general secretion pathway protein D